MGSEELEVQCNQQPTAVSDSCDSSTAVGIANIPYQLAENPSMSVAHSQASTPTSMTGGAAAAILGQSAASQTPPQNMAVQPSVPASPLPHVQVIQQPLQNQYLQHLYAPQQQHMFLPGNLTLQPAIQGIAGAPGLSLQLQGKTMDGKSGGPTIISATPVQTAGNFSASNLMPAGSQMITAGTKTCVQGQMLAAATSKSTAVLQGQSTFIPSTTANQTVVIGQLGMLGNQPSIIPHQAKALSDGQKNKPFIFDISQVLSQQATLHPKSPILPSPSSQCAAAAAAGQMVANNQLKQIPTAPHIISSQAPTMIASQAQLLGSLQALGASLPQGITWATPGSLHSPALFGQNPIFIRSQQSDMFIQTPPPQATIHAVPVAAATAPPAQAATQAQAVQQATAAAAAITAAPQPAAPSPAVAAAPATVAAVQPATPAIAAQAPPSHSVQQHQQQQTPPVAAVAAAQPQPASSAPPPVQKPKQVRPASSVATQTAVSTSSSPHSSASKAQAKQRLRPQLRSSPALSGSSPITQHQSAATQTHSVSPPSHKADAANQTRMSNDIRSSSSLSSMSSVTYNSRLSSSEVACGASESKPEKPMTNMQEVHPTIASSTPIMNVAATSTTETPPPPLPTMIVESFSPEEETSMEVEDSTPPPELVSIDKDEEAEGSFEDINHKHEESKNVETETVGVVAPMAETMIKETTKQPQKAIVKPHVLTHVIEGFVIQEGSEPFPVSRPLVQNNIASTKYHSPDRQITASPVNSSVNENPVGQRKKEKVPKIRSGPVELAKCEFCGKLGPKAKFKRSKRFCSTSCAKRHGSSKRHATATSDSDQKHSGSGKSGKKKKLGFKSKKSWKKLQNRSYEITEWVPPTPIQPAVIEEGQLSNTEDKACNEEEEEEVQFESHEPPIAVVESMESSVMPTSQVEEMEKDCDTYATEYATKSPLKWTVTDVYDFVRNLPGCSDYADEFRSQEIDGQALLLLKEDHLMSTMSMKLGPALKVCARINTLKEEAHH